jgi:Arc/MetJ family transcription regulator
MSRTNIDIDDELCQQVMDRYHLATKRDAVNLALSRLAGEPLGIDEARSLRGSAGRRVVGTTPDQEITARQPAEPVIRLGLR